VATDYYRLDPGIPAALVESQNRLDQGYALALLTGRPDPMYLANQSKIAFISDSGGSDETYASAKQEEKRKIVKALESTGGDISEAAEILRVRFPELAYKMKKHGITEYFNGEQAAYKLTIANTWLYRNSRCEVYIGTAGSDCNLTLVYLPGHTTNPTIKGTLILKSHDSKTIERDIEFDWDDDQITYPPVVLENILTDNELDPETMIVRWRPEREIPG